MSVRGCGHVTKGRFAVKRDQWGRRCWVYQGVFPTNQYTLFFSHCRVETRKSIITGKI